MNKHFLRGIQKKNHQKVSSETKKKRRRFQRTIQTHLRLRSLPCTIPHLKILKNENFHPQDKQKEEPESPAPTAVAPSLPGPSSTITNLIQHHPEEAEDALECLELPPPMKPIQDASQIVGDDNCIQTTNPSNSKALDESDLAEIEQIVKEKMVSGRKRHFPAPLGFIDNLFLQEKHEASLKHPQSLSPQVSENEDVSFSHSTVLTSLSLIRLQNYGNDASISIDDILRKRMFALKELVSTEESYVQDLSLIVNG